MIAFIRVTPHKKIL